MPQIKHYSFLLFLLWSHLLIGQKKNLKEQVLERFHFRDYEFLAKDQTITYFVHQKENTNPENLVLYLQGTTPTPQGFFGIEPKGSGYSYFQYFPSDYELLDDTYVYCVIVPPGLSGIENVGEKDIEKYHQLNSLEYRVFQADEVINHLATNFPLLKKVIVYGHSEGASVAAKLGTVNKRISHLGFWGGNALPDFYDFIMFERKSHLQGVQSDSLTQTTIDSYISLFNDIARDSTNTTPTNENEIAEYTNKRWWSYAEPPINHLLKIDIPLFVQAATMDDSAPIESNYLIPLEFIRLSKKNLQFNVCVGCDHGFVNVSTGEDQWPEIFSKFIQWTNQ